MARRPLAAWLVDWAADDGPPMHLVGHSLGARVICECLRALADEGVSGALASVSLLGGAIPHRSVETGDRYGDAIAAAAPRFTNYYSGTDTVLGWIYRARTRSATAASRTRAAPPMPTRTWTSATA